MSASSITLFNFMLHSLVLGLLGWLAVRWCLRDARRRAHAAFLAVMVTLVAPWGVSTWPYPYHVAEAPVLTKIHQALQTEWRIKVDTASAPSFEKQGLESSAPAPFWTFDKALNLLRVIWLVGFIVLIIRLHWQGWMAWRWRLKLRVPTSEEFFTMPRSIHEEIIRVFDHEGSPCVVGLIAPVIAIPASAFGSLTSTQWRWLLRHEGEHLRGGDVAATWLLGWVRAFGWWNPFIHALIECFTRSREEICDAAAVSATTAPAAYAEFLLDMVSESQACVPSAVPMVSSRPARRLRARLTALMSGRAVRRRLGWGYLTGSIIGFVSAYLFIASIGITAQAESPTQESTPESTAQSTRSFSVHPDFLTQGQSSGERLTAKKLLEKAGVTFPEGASAVMSAATLQLIVRNTEANLLKVEKVVADANVIPIQVYTRTQFIEADHTFGTHGQILSREETEKLLAAINASKEARALSAPSVTMRVGQTGTVEVVRMGEGAFKDKFAGVRVELAFQHAKGGRIKASVKSSIGQDPSKPMDIKGAPVDWPKIEVRSAEARQVMAADETLVLHMPRAARQVTVLLTVQAIHPAGGSAKNFDSVREVPSTRVYQADAFKDLANAAEEQTKAAAQRKISMAIMVVDALRPKQAEGNDPLALSQWVKDMINIPSDTKVADTILNGAEGGFQGPAPSVYSIAGVFTDPQFQLVVRAMHSHNGVTITSLPNATIKNDEDFFQEMPKGQGGGKLRVQPTIGPDGYTIDLVFAPPHEGNTHEVTTAVTIWDGQTVALGGLMKEDEQGKHLRFIFITSKMIDPPAKPSK